MPKKLSSPAGQLPLPVELVERRIYLIRGQKVMLDSDLAELYQVPTFRLNEAVKRNRNRFPEDFMFQLSKEELENWRSQIAISNPGVKMGLRRPPYAFTEHGPGHAFRGAEQRPRRTDEYCYCSRVRPDARTAGHPQRPGPENRKTGSRSEAPGLRYRR